MESETTAHPSVSNQNIWFIYRNNGQEVTVFITGNGNITRTSHLLTSQEIEHVSKHSKSNRL